ncbi:MAG TPA: ribbon-helix-helix protein, CopG family [Thermoanaerobaculia bacterium]|nr:ribbon-helix-helix protein, CopG family [Thermoanaerobaculia bacterium]
MLAIHIDPETERRLAALAARTGRSPDDHVRDAIRTHLEDLEDLELAKERLQNPAKRWTLEEVERKLGLDG